MQSPDPANTVEILLNDCRASDGEWLFALLDKIATHFEVTPQRLQFKSCIDVVCNSDGSNCIPARRAGLQMLPLELYGVPGQTSSAEIAQNISLELRRDPNVLGTDFKVSGAQIHQDPSSNNGKGGVGTGAIVALVIISMLIAVVASMLYFKMDTVQALYRRARRFVKSRILGEDGLDVDEDGVTYGDGHAGQMHKANVEISYELEGTHEVDDRDNEKIEDSPLQIPEQCKPDPESEHANL